MRGIIPNIIVLVYFLEQGGALSANQIYLEKNKNKKSCQKMSFSKSHLRERRKYSRNRPVLTSISR